MPEDKGRPDVSSDATLTPSAAISVEPTAAQTSPPPSAASPLGKLPARYQLAGTLGKGGMGEVLLATDQQIGRDVAIKRMIVTTPALEARFLREARIQGRLEHPAIVPVHELTTDSDGRPFFVMKRLTGVTLADMLASQGTKFSREKLLRAFAEVCLAVEFAHQKGIVHRDLKPSNIMLGDFGEVYVLDWGIARILAEADDDIAATIQSAGPDATEIGAVLGTLGYMSPEQLRGQSIDGRSDVFALGCILFEIVGGQPLLPRTLGALEEAFSLIVRRASGRAQLRDIPPELVALCIESTQLDPDRRLASARELGERLEKFLDGDRDLELRKQLAADHAKAARDALAGGDGETERATAMREAGRSIALDPTGRDAAELVGRLMLEPPRSVPLEVEQRLARIADATTRRRANMVAFFALGLAMFLPFMAWMGITNVALVGALGAAVAVNGLFALAIARRKQQASLTMLQLSVVFDAIVVGLLARIFTPFLIAPGIAAVSVTMFLADPRIKPRLVITFAIAAVLGPWVLELCGLLPKTIGELSGDLVLHSPGIHVALPAAAIALGAYVAALILLAGIVARRLSDETQRSLHAVELQAWHLRQLVTRA